MHAIGVSKKEYPVLIWMGMPRRARKQNSFVWEWNVAWLAQGSGDGWIADRLVGGLGRTPTPGQK